MQINNNVAAFNAYRNLSVSQGQLGKSLEKLSSGFRINRAADDASGLVISEGLRSQIGGLRQATRNAQDGVSVVQTAEGALTEVHSMLQRMRDLAVQVSSTGTYGTDAKNAAQAEFDQLAAEIDRISTSTKFGDKVLFDGSLAKAAEVTAAPAQAEVWTSDAVSDWTTVTSLSVDGNSVTVTDADTSGAIDQGDVIAAINAASLGYTAAADGTDAITITADTAGAKTAIAVTGLAGSVSTPGADEVAAQAEKKGAVFQVGAFEGDTIAVGIDALNITSLGLAGITDLTAAGTLTAIDDAIGKVSTQRGALGAVQNRFEHTVANLQVAVENLTASESRIRDTDMAAEMTTFTRNQIMQQAGTAMLAQANQLPQSVLSLLR